MALYVKGPFLLYLCLLLTFIGTIYAMLAKIKYVCVLGVHRRQRLRARCACACGILSSLGNCDGMVPVLPGPATACASS